MSVCGATLSFQSPVTSVGGVGPFRTVERSKGWTLGGISILVCVCVCARARCPSLRDGFSSRSLLKVQSLDVYSRVCKTHMKHRPWEANDKHSWPCGWQLETQLTHTHTHTRSRHIGTQIIHFIDREMQTVRRSVFQLLFCCTWSGSVFAISINLPE